jgi:hypothetical protein
MPAAYVITGQNQTQEINPAGTGFHTVWNVSYRITDGPAKGTPGSIQFTEDEHTADMVKAAIDAKVKVLNDVAGIGG